mgnify:CR=1 FL=1
MKSPLRHNFAICASVQLFIKNVRPNLFNFPSQYLMSCKPLHRAGHFCSCYFYGYQPPYFIAQGRKVNISRDKGIKGCTFSWLKMTQQHSERPKCLLLSQLWELCLDQVCTGEQRGIALVYCPQIGCLTWQCCVVTCVSGRHSRNLSLSDSKSNKLKIAIIQWWWGLYS